MYLSNFSKNFASHEFHFKIGKYCSDDKRLCNIK